MNLLYMICQRFTIFSLLFTFQLYSCEFESAELEPGLPRITSDGNNHAGFYFGDQLFSIDPIQVNPKTGEGEQINFKVFNDSTVGIGLFNKNGTAEIGLVFDLRPGPYKTTLANPQNFYIGYSVFGKEVEVQGIFTIVYYYVKNEDDGYIHIIRNDSSVIAGTFEFVAYSEELNDSIKISKGRFDILKPQ